jgi:hypothetical protein
VFDTKKLWVPVVKPVAPAIPAEGEEAACAPGEADDEAPKEKVTQWPRTTVLLRPRPTTHQ